MKSIIFLLPAFISINYGKEKKSINEMLIEYGVYCCAINLLMLLVLIMIGRAKESLSDSGSIKFCFLYLASSMIIAYCLPRIFNYCKNNFDFKVKRVKNEKM